MGGKSRLWDVYNKLEPVLLPGAKIKTDDAWLLCRGMSIYYGAISNHFRTIMKILINTGHVIKLQEKGWYFVKMTPENPTLE